MDDWDLGELIPEARGANVALNKPVRVVPQRDCGPGWSASLLVDASNGWSHSYGAADQAVTGWLQVDLGASQAVNRATLLGLMTAPNADASILRVSAEHLQGTQVRLSGTSPVSTVGGVSRAMSRPEGQSMAFVSQW
ncbi:hypothetical protein EV685_2513 [Sphaerotilus mobilis]|uniref:F5/8 type C domain-containing protein n=1 Tax=Sphaerotilus mobilis TaxID=47994 RepID=A0A4Q7LM29_9BURK|nr:hypothetical protein EV685_2513 [Sphaerotilus mobilis]